MALSGAGRKRKGQRREWQTRKLMESLGYYVVKSAKSQGVWDLVGVRPTSPQTILTQVKSNRITGREWGTLVDFPTGPDTGKYAVIWLDGKGYPNIRPAGPIPWPTASATAPATTSATPKEYANDTPLF